MKSSDIKTLSVEELQQKLLTEREHLQKLKFAHAISPIENPIQIKETRKNIARILTELKQKELQNN